jgi:hypothetical protein
MDWLCLLNDNNGEVTWPVSAFAQFCGIGEELTRSILLQLELTGVANVEWQTLANDSKGMAKLSNRRMVRAGQNQQQISMVRSEAGKKGAEKKWQKWQPSSSSSLNLNHIPKKEYEKRGTAQAPIVLPDWMPKVEWDSFVEFRISIRKPLKARAIILAIKTLSALRAQGHDVGAVIDQSVMNGWAGLFPTRPVLVQQQEGELSERTQRILKRGL